jgi:hypothetical protein
MLESIFAFLQNFFHSAYTFMNYLILQRMLYHSVVEILKRTPDTNLKR